MKKTVLIFLCGVLLTGSAVHAEDNTMAVPISVRDQETFLASYPFFYSYESGAWITSSPGRIFTTVDQAPDFVLPFLKTQPQPIRYPHWALREGWEGELIVAIEIRENGRVGRWKVMRSSGHPSLDRAAVETVRKWRFESGKLKGKPIISCVQIPIRFMIDKN